MQNTLDKLFSIRDSQSQLEHFAILNRSMNVHVVISLLLSIFDTEGCEVLARALQIEISRIKAFEARHVEI